MPNTRRRPVRKRAPAGADRRVARTRHALGTALVQLMLEQPLDEITVQQVLDRAGVARATFYEHFKDKQDLFLSATERILAWLDAQLDASGARPGRLYAVEELCAHVGEQGPLLRALRESGELDLVWELFTAQFARTIERRLRVLAPPTDAPLSPALQARFCAGALVETLQAWLEREPRPAPRAMDEAWHAMAWRALRGGPPRSAGPQSARNASR
jgi:AcrR family transcriptional regulator